MTKKDEELDARMIERMEVLETRIGRFEESIRSIMAEFRQSLRAEMENGWRFPPRILALVGACCLYQVKKDRWIKNWKVVSP